MFLVAIDTNSMIFNPKCNGLCDGAEITLRYVMELKNGGMRANGTDMFAKTVLMPKTTVYFSVSLKDFEASKAIFFGVTFQKENPDGNSPLDGDYGTAQKIYLHETDLLK